MAGEPSNATSALKMSKKEQIPQGHALLSISVPPHSTIVLSLHEESPMNNEKRIVAQEANHGNGHYGPN
jgi:hypothetical protein